MTYRLLSTNPLCCGFALNRIVGIQPYSLSYATKSYHHRRNNHGAYHGLHHLNNLSIGGVIHDDERKTNCDARNTDSKLFHANQHNPQQNDSRSGRRIFIAEILRQQHQPQYCHFIPKLNADDNLNLNVNHPAHPSSSSLFYHQTHSLSTYINTTRSNINRINHRHIFQNNPIPIPIPIRTANNLYSFQFAHAFCSNSNSKSDSNHNHNNNNNKSKSKKPQSSSSTSISQKIAAETTSAASTSAPSSSSASSSWMSFLNPITLFTKVGSLLWRFIYATFDSIIHPHNGWQRLKSMGHKIKTEFYHYKHGASLMKTDLIQARKIGMKYMRGGEITYRERRQLQRVSLDLLRLFPMMVIVLIPALEVLLPFLLWFFPNMLPSRFQHESNKVKKRKRQLQARLGMISFWEDTLGKFIDERKKNTEDWKNSDYGQLEDLLRKIQNKEEIPNEQILTLASFFNDEITLDNASSAELSNMCGYMTLNTYGTPTMLRMRLKNKVRDLRREDKEIHKEGVDDLPLSLLKQLLRERGMRADFEEWVLKSNMKRWLELSLDREIPLTLLIQSRIFTLNHVPGAEPGDLLKQTISTISEGAAEEVLVDRVGVIDAEIEKKVIQRQAKLIEEEAELELEEQKQQKLRSQESKKKPESEQPTEHPSSVADKTEPRSTESDDQGIDVIRAKKKRKKMLDMAEALEVSTADSALDPERADLHEYEQKLSIIRDDIDSNTARVIADDSKRKLKTFDSDADLDAQTTMTFGLDSDASKTATTIIEEPILTTDGDQKTVMATEDADSDSDEDIDIGKHIKTEHQLENRLAKMIAKAQKVIKTDTESERVEINPQLFADPHNITYDEIKQLLPKILLTSEHWMHEDDIEVFLKELDERRKTGLKLTREELAHVIEQLIEDYEEFGSDDDK